MNSFRIKKTKTKAGKPPEVKRKKSRSQDIRRRTLVRVRKTGKLIGRTRPSEKIPPPRPKFYFDDVRPLIAMKPSGFAPPEPLPEFDPFSTPLQTGTVMIEANAGSGKTFSIEYIFLRLVLEKGLQPNEIATLTFTRNGTAELRDRIRKRLWEVWNDLEAGRSVGGLEKALDAVQPDVLKQRAWQAVRRIDELGVFTIHGFCGAVLREFAVETGSFAVNAPVETGSEIALEAAKNVWRRFVASHPPVLVGVFRALFNEPKNLLEFHSGRLNRANLSIQPDFAAEDLERLGARLENVWRDFGESFDGNGLRDFIEARRTNRRKFRKNDLERWIGQIEKHPSLSPQAISDTLKKFSRSELEKAGVDWKGTIPVSLSFLLDTLELLEQTQVDLVRHLKNEMDRELDDVRREKDVLTYDALILNVHKALRENRELAEKLSRRYRAGLIDEFQDTDLLQIEIFSKIFSGENSSLYLIGDPKQSIYRFRSADVFAYDDVKRRTEPGKIFGLSANRRSRVEVTETVNRLFATVEEPFALDFIRYRRSLPLPQGDKPALAMNGSVWSGVYFCPLPKQGKAAEKLASACEEVALRIREMLRHGRWQNEDSAKPGGSSGENRRRIQAGEIAVLTKTNDQIEAAGKALLKLGIPTLGDSRSNVLNTGEAEELALMMRACCEWERLPSILAWLALPSCGKNLEDLEAIRRDPDLQNGLQQNFKRYLSNWKEEGLTAAFLGFSSDYGWEESLGNRLEGRKKISHFRHLLEWVDQTFPPLSSRSPKRILAEFLKTRERDRLKEDETYRIRDLNEAEAVRLMTVHRAKGLEFPVVFCPFNDSPPPSPKEKGHLFRREKGFVLEMVHADKEKESDELFSESLRLAYVALTRASSLCIAHFDDDEKNEKGGKRLSLSVFRHLLGEKPVVSENLPDPLSGKDVFATLPLPRKDEGKPFEEPSEVPRPKSEPPEIRRTFDRPGIYFSFSSLLTETHRKEGPANERPNFSKVADSSDDTEAEQTRVPSILDFPGGTAGGNFWHEILERFDFRSADSDFQTDEFETSRRSHGIGEEWKPVIRDTLQRLLELRCRELPDGFRFARLQKERTLREVEFNLCASPRFYETLEKLRRSETFAALPEEARKSLEILNAERNESFLRGFVDLVFEWRGKIYFADWKTNFLGGSSEDYRPDSLRLEMERRNYFLQSLIYAIALTARLARECGATSAVERFGGSFYVFLRGLNQDRDNETRTLLYDPMEAVKPFFVEFNGLFLREFE